MSKFLFLAWGLLCFPMAIFSETTISFADANVKSICVKNWDTDGDNELSPSEAASVTDLSGSFKSTSIRSFDELRFFTGLTSIAASSFDGCSNLTAITIPESITTIGSNAFKGCNSLETITVLCSEVKTWFKGLTSIKYLQIDNGVIDIGNSAFKGCTGLTSIKISEGVTTIGSSAFEGCKAVDEITIPQSVTSIKTSAFKDCVALKSVNLSEGLTSIGSTAFKGCTSLTTLVIPKSVSSIGGQAFEETGLSSVTILCNEIGSSWFANITALTNVVLAKDITTIGNSAFKGCTGLTSIKISEGVTTIGSSAFEGCKAVDEITIPQSVTSIKTSAFKDCVALKSVNLSEGLTSIGSTAFKGCTSLTTLVIPKSVSSIGGQAFEETGLSSVTILCNEIGSSWFANITTLTNVVLAKDITSIGNYAFKGCTGLTDFQLTNITTIGSSAFEGCTGIKDLVFPASVTTIRNSAFKNSGLETITLHTPIVGAGWFRDLTSLKNVIFGSEVTDIKEQAFEGCTGLYQIDIPLGVNTIGSRAFYGCTNITSVVIPNSITQISSSAFQGGGLKKLIIHTKEVGDSWFDNVQTLTEISFGDEVSQIGKSAFRKCSGLTSLKLTPNITTIGNYAFCGCSSLVSIIIPATVKSIGSLSFTETQLTSAEINCLEIGSSCFKGVTTLEKLILGDAVTSIEASAFAGCTGLTEVTIPKNVTKLVRTTFQDCPITKLDIKCKDLPNECFKGMTTLNKLILDNNVVSIGAGAFQDCAGLSDVNLGKNLTTIRERAFKGCSNLVSIYIPINVTDINKTAFSNSGLTTVELHCKEMGRAWFEDITSIQNLIIGEEVTNIGSYAFKNCTGLTSISIPGNVKSIDEGAFEGCSDLSSVSISDGVVSIASVAFRYCSKLSSIPLPDTVIDTNYSAFEGTAWYESQPEGMVYIGKNALRYKAEKGIPEGTSIEIKEGTLAIGRNCFTYVSVISGKVYNGLTSVTLPNSIINIGERAFGDCMKLKSVYSYIEDPRPIPDEVFVYWDVDGKMHQLNNVRETHFTLYVPKGTREKYLSTEGWIKARVIEEMGQDEIVVTANDKTRVYGDTNPSFDYTVSQGEISGTPELKCDATKKSSVGKYEIKISSGTVTTPNVTYLNGTLTITKAPLTISVGEYTIEQGEDLPEFKITYDGFKNNETEEVLTKKVVLSYTATSTSEPGEYAIGLQGAEATNYEINYVPGKLTITPARKVYTLTYIIDNETYKVVEYEEGATITPEEEPASREGYTFSGWKGLPETMPNYNVTVTGSYTINKYKLIYIVDNIEYSSYDVEYGAIVPVETEPTKEGFTFSGWSEIPSTMPAMSVIITGYFVMSTFELNGLKYQLEDGKVSITGFNSDDTEVVIPTAIEIDGENYSVTSISLGAFQGCKGITSLIISNGIENIGDEAFAGCSNLKEIIIGNRVTRIGSRAFANVSRNSNRTRTEEGLKVVCYATEVPETAPDAFDNTEISKALLLVEDASVNSYKSLSPWNGFGNIRGINDYTAIEGIQSKAIGSKNLFDLYGNRICQMKRGVNIIRQSDGKTKKVVFKR